MADQDHDEIADLLRECEDALIELKENQRLVQDGGKAFAELASRLRMELERRTGTDRRAEIRAAERRTDRANSA
jgi:hypothetical protein